MAIEFNTFLSSYGPADVRVVRLHAAPENILDVVKQAGISTGSMTAEEAHRFAQACAEVLIRPYAARATAHGKYETTVEAARAEMTNHEAAKVAVNEMAQDFLRRKVVGDENHLQQFANTMLGRVARIAEERTGIGRSDGVAAAIR